MRWIGQTTCISTQVVFSRKPSTAHSARAWKTEFLRISNTTKMWPYTTISSMRECQGIGHTLNLGTSPGLRRLSRSRKCMYSQIQSLRSIVQKQGATHCSQIIVWMLNAKFKTSFKMKTRLKPKMSFRMRTRHRQSLSKMKKFLQLKATFPRKTGLNLISTK